MISIAGAAQPNRPVTVRKLDGEAGPTTCVGPACGGDCVVVVADTTGKRDQNPGLSFSRPSRTGSQRRSVSDLLGLAPGAESLAVKGRCSPCSVSG
jgi:hypothetical protein